jgi:RNA polymerase sigma-70 factor (ECF subfamily)
VVPRGEGQREAGAGAAAEGQQPPALLVSLGESFETFYAREYRRLVALTYVLSGDRALAEDLAQDAMTTVYRSWARVSVMAGPAGYLRRTAANLAASTVRRRVREARAMLRLSRQPVAVAELNALDEQFWSAVRRLPRRQAQAVALRYVYDMTVLEVAEAMEISEGATKAHLHRARTSLARTLQVAVSDEPEVTA